MQGNLRRIFAEAPPQFLRSVLLSAAPLAEVRGFRCNLFQECFETLHFSPLFLCLSNLYSLRRKLCLRVTTRGETSCNLFGHQTVGSVTVRISCPINWEVVKFILYYLFAILYSLKLFVYHLLKNKAIFRFIKQTNVTVPQMRYLLQNTPTRSPQVVTRKFRFAKMVRLCRYRADSLPTG